MVTETDLRLGDGRTLHAYDTATDAGDARLTVLWHHGTPNTGAPPEPLFPAAARLGIRWVSYDRPGYGRSTPRPGRDVASAPADAGNVHLRGVRFPPIRDPQRFPVCPGARSWRGCWGSAADCDPLAS